jgi:hypothetical protein
MTAWKLKGEMGHGTEQMIERRYGRHAKHKAKRPVLEFRWQEWRDRTPVVKEKNRSPYSISYGDQLAAGLASVLSPAQQRALGVLAESRDGLTSLEWQTALSSNPGTFFPQRHRLVQLELVTNGGGGRGSKFQVTQDGAAVLRAIESRKNSEISAGDSTQ